jgi:hypothetical protein
MSSLLGGSVVSKRITSPKLAGVAPDARRRHRGTRLALPWLRVRLTIADLR